MAVQGSTITNEQYIRVDLIWLAFPVGLWILLTILLMATVVTTSHLDIPVWKCSALPMIECTNPGNGVESQSQLKRQARDTKIQLLPTDGSGWYLTRQPEHDGSKA